MKPSLRWKIAFAVVVYAAMLAGTYFNGFVMGERHVLQALAPIVQRMQTVPPPVDWYQSANNSNRDFSIDPCSHAIGGCAAISTYLQNDFRNHDAGVIGTDHVIENGFFVTDPGKAVTLAAFQQQVIPPPAQPSPLPTSPITPTLGVTILALAGLTATFLNGIKSSLPQIGGWGAKFLAVAIATTGTIAVAPAGQPPLVTAGAALTAALAAMGVHDYASGKSSVTPAPVPASK